MDSSAKSFPLWTALITPLNPDNSIDFTSFGKLLKQQEQAKNGILILGSTGEGLALNLQEKKSVLEFTIAEKLQVPIMVGVGGFQLGECLEWINYANQFSIHAFLLVTPLYAKPGRYGQLGWFTKLLDAAKKPCMLYNIPGRAAVALNKETFHELSNHPNCWALKEASGSTNEFRDFYKLAGKVELFSGDDGMTFEFCKLGGKGLVSVASNVWPKATHRYVEYCLDQNQEAILPFWSQASESLFRASNPVPVKKLMAKLNLISHPTLRAPLSEKDLGSLTEQLNIHEQMQLWEQQHLEKL